MNRDQIFIDMALKAWNIQIARADKFFNTLSDEGLLKEIAPGKNRIIYLLGHLITVNEGMITLFSLGNRSYSDWDEAFIKNPDKTISDVPDAATLRHAWSESNERLTKLFSEMSVEDWFGRHTSMTDEDLVKEPSRNKLSVLLNRTSHVAYHLGQLVLAK
ncbi:MAG TPA: DinB family protein [Chryseosolibacter sp.]